MTQKMLITGAAGTIGQLLISHLNDRYDLLLTDIKEPTNTGGYPFIKADLSSFTSIDAVFKQGADIHTVIHLGADIRTTAPWESLLPNNIVGTYNVFEAAAQAGVKRIIYASSINSVDGYPAGVQVNTSMPVAPANLYGASKAWGEALGRFYADQQGIAVHCLRIGWLTPHDGEYLCTEATNILLHMTITHRDLMIFFDACLQSELGFGMWHVLSDNFWNRLDISDTSERLGFAPLDDGYTLSGKIADPETF